jgi:dipeptide/tripeptide permease
MLLQERRTPSVFYWLLPLGMANIFCVGIAVSSLVLHTIQLAAKSPERVFLLPALLQHFSPEVLAGVVLGIFNFGTGIVGPLAGKVSDQLGMKISCYAFEVMQVVGAGLMGHTSMYLLGLLLLTIGSGASQPVFQALFSSQFEDERMTQKHVTYLYAMQNLAFLVSTVLAGIQPFWLGYVQAAALGTMGLLFFSLAPVKFRDASPEHAKSQAYPLSARQSARARGFGFLCIFSFLFFVVFLQFLGGPFMLFVRDMVGAWGTTTVPPQMFLGLNGLTDLIMAGVLVRIYKMSKPVRFFDKLQYSFVWLMAASGLVSLISTRSPSGQVRPEFAALAIVFISIGELHYNPVMLAAISTEMPASLSGFFTGVHYMIIGVAGSLAGLGVPIYQALGPASYFGRLTVVAACGVLGLGLAKQHLQRTFQDEDDLSECKALRD